MSKIVYNACHGGFGLSEAGMMRWAELKGIKLYPEKDKFNLTTFWLVPPGDRVSPLEGENWHLATYEQRVENNRLHREQTVDDRNIPRHDPALVQTVEELGEAANGLCAKLRIEEIPPGSLYRIEEYDGSETIARPETDQWNIAS